MPDNMVNESDVARVLRYLECHYVMSVATTGPEGIWNTAVFYANQRFKLFFVSPPDTQHCRNIGQNPQVAATIHEDYADWQAIKGLQIGAVARKVDADQQNQIIDLYKKKFPFLNDATMVVEKILRALHKSSWYELTPSRICFVDNERGFGKRLEIPIDRPVT
jgi:uncharacterized protein YhbP (UPF0306 family)